MAKTTITKSWAIGTWEQRSLLNYVCINDPIDGRKCDCCIDSKDQPDKVEYDDTTGILYEKYDNGVSPIFKTTIVKEA